MVNNVDENWIYDRSNILYIIAIDIIFRKMLGYKNCKFDKQFYNFGLIVTDIA